MDEVKKLIVSLHDVHPGSGPLIRRQREALRLWGVKSASLLVVPRFHHGRSVAEDSFLMDELSQLEASGDELVLHGHYHDCEGQPMRPEDWFWTRYYTSGEAEFLSLSPEAAEVRWTEGIRLFEQNQWNLSGFIAPAWLLNPELIPLLEGRGFDYTVVHGGVLTRRGGWRVESVPTLCWSTRARWRRVCSLGWNAWQFARVQECSVLRISLHPGDIEFASIWKQMERQVKSSLDQGRTPITYAEYAAG